MRSHILSTGLWGYPGLLASKQSSLNKDLDTEGFSGKQFIFILTVHFKQMIIRDDNKP